MYTNTKRYKAIFVISGVNVENIDLLYLASAFLLGYIVRGTLAFLYNLGTMANFVKDITYELQGLIIGVAQDVEFIKEAKYQILDSAGADENLIKRERNMDEYSFGVDHGNVQTIWKLEFEYEQSEVFGSKFSSLQRDLDFIPIEYELEETAILKTPCFITSDNNQKNIYFQYI